MTDKDQEPINLLDEHLYERPLKSTKRPFFLVRPFVLAVIGITLLVGVVRSFTHTNGSTDSTSTHPTLFGAVRQLVTSGDKSLSGEDSDRINILLLGIGGAGHDGPELTDTIIFASIRPSTKEVGMLSIPRDLSVPLKGYGWQKINHANAYGELDNPGNGPQIAADTIGSVLDQPIDYWVKVDFKGFEEFIDAIGGIDIDVERSFTDPTYPLDDEAGSTETLTFEEGLQHMDGATALQFVRSRHGNNGEGSDFARAARQQKVILAVKKELLSATTLLNPAKISRLIDTLKSNIHTNVSSWELVRLANMGNLFDSDNISNVVLSTAPGSPLYETTVNGAYVILPKNNDWTPIQNLAEQIFTADDQITQLPDALPRDIRVEVQNGTTIPGFATQTADLLTLQGYQIVAFGNAKETEQDRTRIYDLSNGAHRTELIALQDFLDADLSLSAPGWLLTEDILPEHLTPTSQEGTNAKTASQVDFLVILGQSSANRIR